MLEPARARPDRASARNVGFTVADAVRLPFDDEAFDVAFLATVLGEVVDRATAAFPQLALSRGKTRG